MAISPKDYKQFDKKWGGHSGNGGHMSANGCGPTSAADILGGLPKLNTNKKITPVKVWDWMANKGLVGGGGAGRDGVVSALKHFGIKEKDITKIYMSNYRSILSEKKANQAIKALRNPNNWAIILTTWFGGHFTVAYAANGNKIKICDPGSSYRKSTTINEFKKVVRSAIIINISDYGTTYTKKVKALFTTYGPPWGPMEGGNMYAWAPNHGTPEEDLKKGILVCAAPPEVPFGTKVKVSGTGTKYDGKIFIVKDRGGAIKIEKGVYHFDLLIKNRLTQGFKKNGTAIITEEYSSNSIDDDTGTIDLRQAIAQLYSSDNYKYISNSTSKEESNFLSAIKSAVISAISNMTSSVQNVVSDATDGINDYLNTLAEINSVTIDLEQVERKLVKGILSTYPNLVQAPFIEVDLNGITIGGYKNNEDIFPNHVTGLNVEKINGRINNYTINISHQVRAGEDPNFIDSLLSRTGFRNKIKIKYGDSAYGSFFKEEEAYIINVSYSENIVSSKIDYTIYAVSSLGTIQQAYFNFPGITSKPSTEIINMLYKNKNTSNQLLNLLGGMQNKTATLGKGYIPTDDAEVYIPGGENMSLIERLNQLVTYMYDPINPSSSYFLSYEDNSNNNSFFKITKVSKTTNNSDVIKNCYYLDVGYPGDAFVTNFNINSDVYWPLYYEYADSISEYNYDIDYNGKLITTKINPLTISDRYSSIDVTKMNWWEFVSSYPISATITLKGLMKPVILMENVYIYAQFYGQKDMASGLYSIVGQKDKIDGNGYTTTLELLRVQN